MALFGDSPRFYPHITKCDEAAVYGKYQTEDHVGPGSYFSIYEENKRTGWVQKSAEESSPRRLSKSTSLSVPPSPSPIKTPIKRSLSRSDSYRNDLALPSGIIVAGQSSKDENPGPGYYAPPIVVSTALNSPAARNTSFNRSFSTGKVSIMGTSPRMGQGSKEMIIRNGVIIHKSSRDDAALLGPGTYSPPVTRSLLQKSFNKRSTSGNHEGTATAKSFLKNGVPSPSPSQRGSPVTTPAAAPVTPRNLQRKFSSPSVL